MTDEIERGQEQVEETGESRSIENQQLQDATLEPRTSIEQGGEVRQAEQVQEAFTAITKNTEELPGNQPEVRGDLDQATITSEEPVEEQATPINLPGPEEPESRGTPELPRQEARFEQPLQARQDQEAGVESGLDQMGPKVPGFTDLPGEDGPGSRGDLPSGGLPSELGDAGISIDDMLKGASGHFEGLPGEGPTGGAIHPKYGTGEANPGSLVSEGSDDQVDWLGFFGAGDDSKKGGKKDTNAGADVNLNATFYTGEAVRQLEVDALKASAQKDYGRLVTVNTLLDKIYNNNPNAGVDGGIVWHSGGGKDSSDSEKMPRPDGGDSGGDAKHIDPSEIKPPSDEVTDPAYPQGKAMGSAGSENTKDPRLVSDPAEWQDSGKPSPEAHTSTGSEQVTDPPEPEDGLHGKSSTTTK